MRALLLHAALALCAPAAQDGRAAPQAGGGTAPAAAAAADLPPVEAPPALTVVQAEDLGRLVKLLRADKAEYRAAMEARVLAFGRGAIPALAKAATTNHPGQMDAIDNCLVALADARDRDFTTECLASKLPVLRRFAAREIGQLGQASLLDGLLPLLADADEVARNEAALALVAGGREEGLDVLVLIFKSTWRERVLAALPGVAGKGDHAPVAHRLELDARREREEPEVAAKERIAAVELLHAVADGAAQSLLVRALDDKHNVVQREAINALRDLLEHKGPLEGSSIFQQITEVKRLKDVWTGRP